MSNEIITPEMEELIMGQLINEIRDMEVDSALRIAIEEMARTGGSIPPIPEHLKERLREDELKKLTEFLSATGRTIDFNKKSIVIGPSRESLIGTLVRKDEEE